MSPTPDTAGFLASRDVLFANFGVYVAFLIPIEPVYNESVDHVPTDPFYGKPLDPWATPASGAIEGTAFSSAFASATVVTRPYGGRGQVRDDVSAGSIGFVPDEQIGLNIKPSDYATFGPAGASGTATECEFWGTRFEIRQWRADGIGALQRYVVYVSQDGGPE